MGDMNDGLNSFQLLRRLSSQLGFYEYNGGYIRIHKDRKEYLVFIYLSVRAGIQANSVGTTSFFEISTKVSYPHPIFCIRKTTKLDWVVEHIFHMPDYQVGEEDFDTRFFIKLKDKEWGHRFFGRGSIKSCISNLLLNGFDLIHSEDGDLKVIKYLKPGECPSAKMVTNAIEYIGEIISNFPISL